MNNILHRANGNANITNDNEALQQSRDLYLLSADRIWTKFCGIGLLTICPGASRLGSARPGPEQPLCRRYLTKYHQFLLINKARTCPAELAGRLYLWDWPSGAVIGPQLFSGKWFSSKFAVWRRAQMRNRNGNIEMMLAGRPPACPARSYRLAHFGRTIFYFLAPLAPSSYLANRALAAGQEVQVARVCLLVSSWSQKNSAARVAGKMGQLCCHLATAAERQSPVAAAPQWKTNKLNS